MGAGDSVKFKGGSIQLEGCKVFAKALIKAMQILPIFISGRSGKGIIFYLLIGIFVIAFMNS